MDRAETTPQNLPQTPLQTAQNLPDIAPESGQLDWKRAHPLSPLVRVWLLFIAICFFIGREFFEDFYDSGFAFTPSAENQNPTFLQSVFGPFALPVLILAFFVLALIPHVWAWYTTRFAIDETKVYLRKGAIFRSSTDARLDKVQAIDIHQPLIARLLGLAELKFEVADGSSTLLAVQFLKKKDAEDLRVALLRQVQVLKTGGATLPSESLSQAASPVVTESDAAVLPQQLAQETPIFEIPVARNLLAVLMGSAILPLAFAAAVIGLLAWIFDGEFNAWSVFGSAGILGVLASVWGSLNSGHRFRASATDSALKLRYGLTSTTSQTVPLGRIQAISVSQPFFWRFLGWFKVTATIAGYGAVKADDQKTTRNVLLPVGTGQELLDLMPYLIKNHEQGRIDGMQLKAALEGKGDYFGFVLNPRSTRWVNWFTWKRNGFALTPAYLLVRSGFLIRRLRVIPLDKVQSTQVIEGPIDRKLGVAQVDMGMVSGDLTSNRIENVSVENARYLAGLLVQM